jgi:SAM-dependent methyltransferase
VFASLYSPSELEVLRAEQERLIQECPKDVSLICRVRRIIRQHEASFAAPFSSKTRLPIVRPYQGSARFGIRGKRPTERRIGAYGLEDILQADFRVLEVGCNCGFLSLEMARMVAHVTGFDADPHYIAIGKEVQAHAGITNCTLQVSKVETFRTDQRYDCIVSCAVHGWVGLSFPQYVQFLLSLMTPSSVLVFESHELDCHPEWEEQKRHLLGSFDIIRAGWIDDVEEDVYESELREFLVLKRKPARLPR